MQEHRDFPFGPPSKYYPGATMLNFRTQTTMFVVIVVCWHTDMICFSLLLFCIQRIESRIAFFVFNRFLLGKISFFQ